MAACTLELLLIIAFLHAGFGVTSLLAAYALRYAFSLGLPIRQAFRLLPGLRVSPRLFDRSLLRDLKVTGDLTVKQTTKPVTFDVTLQTNQDKLTGTASAEIVLSDFEAGPIQLAMLQTEDKVKLDFDFVALPAQ